MARDIEEFLRRAAERRKKQLKQKQAGQPPRPVPQQPPQRRQRPQQRLVISDEQVEVVRRKKKQDLRDESVAQHVKRHMDSSSVVERASHLAEQLEQTDERLEARLHKKFDRDLGSLEGKSPLDEVAPLVTAMQISPLANDLVEMLKSPKSVRQAIMISEVLKRPDFD